METITQVHQDHSVFESEIRFYLLEINFLLKVLTKEYSIMIESEKIRILDAFWKEFEKCDQKLKTLKKNIHSNEADLSQLLQSKSKHSSESTDINTNKENLRKQLDTILNKLKILKETLYEYLENNHYQHS